MLDLCDTKVYNIITVKEYLTSSQASPKWQKGDNMEKNMTNEQFRIFIKMIIEIIKSSDSKEEAIKKIEALLTK
nr:MAG TPA: hypothetical protein [Caudoviricetes sp.]